MLPLLLAGVAWSSTRTKSVPWAETLFVAHVRAAAGALSSRGGGLLAVGVARGHVEGARLAYAQVRPERRAQSAEAIRVLEARIREAQAQLTRPVEAPPVAAEGAAEGTIPFRAR